MSQETHLAIASAVFILLATGWATKIFCEGAELMDLIGLSTAMLVLGFMAGKML